MRNGQKAGTVRGRMGVLLGLGALFVSGAVYGGVRLYDRYLVKMTVNGRESVHEVEAGPDGKALLEVPLEGGGSARILVGPENAGQDGMIHAEVTVQADSGEAAQTVEIQAIAPDGASKPAGTDEDKNTPAEKKADPR